MTTVTRNNSFHRPARRNIEMKRINALLLLLFFSAVVFAEANGLLKLPDSYRTPLSDMAYDDIKEWRSEPDEENPWRKDGEEALVKPRIKIKLFPKYEYETDKPVSNILELSF